ncbi:MAG: hypothetical protein HC817_06835, partial [Saprospiraceae bacterium]|nr:hypothetical protein [Saprospiraceae bacterium]
VALASCKKEKTNPILGNWKLIKVFDGYFNGGNFQWNNVPDESSKTLIFSENGEYRQKESYNRAYKQCIGTYSLKPDNTLEVNSNCNLGTEKMKISEISSTLLIIDRQVREGVIRFKYIPTK